MDEKTKKQIELHVAGATVRHKSAFHTLESYKNNADLDQAFINEWVVPYYMKLRQSSQAWIDQIRAIKGALTDEIILKNLGDFNWRSRQTGAYFSSIKNKQSFTKIIGTHLLKSEVCFAGAEYAITLAYFNTKEAIDYLETYLDYYLLKPALQFDQKQVMAGLKYLDDVNNTNLVSKHMEQWRRFLEDQEEMNQKYSRSILQSTILTIKQKVKYKELTSPKEIDYSINTHLIAERIATIQKINKDE